MKSVHSFLFIAAVLLSGMLFFIQDNVIAKAKTEVTYRFINNGVARGARVLQVSAHTRGGGQCWPINIVYTGVVEWGDSVDVVVDYFANVCYRSKFGEATTYDFPDSWVGVGYHGGNTLTEVYF